MCVPLLLLKEKKVAKKQQKPRRQTNCEEDGHCWYWFPSTPKVPRSSPRPKNFFFMYPSFNDLRPQASKEEEGKKTVFLPFWKEEKKRWKGENKRMKRSFEQGGKKNNSNKRETCEPQMKPRNVLLDLLAAQSMSGATSDMLLISGKGDCVQSPLRESTTHHDRLLLLLDIVYTSTSTEDPTAQNNRGEKNLLSSCQEWKMVAYEEEYRRRGETDFIQSINFIFLAVSLGPAFRESASQRLKDNRDSWLRWRAP